MTDAEIIEIAAHPHVQAFIRRIAEEEARKVLTSTLGSLTYEEAALFIGCPRESIRWYVHHGELERGAGRGKVTIASCAKFKLSYRPLTTNSTS